MLTFETNIILCEINDEKSKSKIKPKSEVKIHFQIMGLTRDDVAINKMEQKPFYTFASCMSETTLSGFHGSCHSFMSDITSLHTPVIQRASIGSLKGI